MGRGSAASGAQLAPFRRQAFPHGRYVGGRRRPLSRNPGARGSIRPRPTAARPAGRPRRSPIVAC
eukprot:4099194-Pleurochrysis_carterae.AAC.1